MAAQFKYVMLMVSDVMKTVQFYREGLGLEVKVESPAWAELDAGGTTIALHHAPGGATSGEGTILSFNVDDIHAALAALEAVGGKLEGQIREPSFGKVAAVRSPEGQLISLLQPAAVAAAP